MRLPRLAAFLFAASLAAADDPDRLALRPGLKAGASITRTTETAGKGTIAVESGGKTREFKTAIAGIEEVAEEVLEATDGRASREKRWYHRKESSFKVPELDKKEERTSSVVNHLLTLERKDGKTAAASADRNIEPKELAGETMDDEWDIPLWPAAPVAPGDSWKPDAKSVKSWAEARGRKVEEATLDCTFAKIETLDGRRCARIEISFAAKGTTRGTEKQPEQKIAWSLDGDAWWSLDDARVVQFSLKGDLRTEWDVADRGEHWTSKTKLTLEGSSTPGKASFEVKKGDDK